MADHHGRRFQAVTPLIGLWRAPHSLHVGLDDRAVTLEPVPTSAAEVLPLLDEPRTLDELSALTPDLSLAWLTWLLSSLEEGGLVRSWRPRPSPPVVVWGTGALAERVHLALQRAELQPLPLGQSHWPSRHQPLIVLATGTVEPERWLTDRIVSTGHAALIVRAEPGRGVIGPFLSSAPMPCLRCLDLRRSETDPQWPRLLAQLCRTRTVADPRLLEWLAGEAVAEASRWRAGEPSELAGRTLELGLPGFVRARASWAPHPACPCRQSRDWDALGTLAG